MDRRDFVKSASAALAFLPSLQWLTRVPKPVDLSIFADRWNDYAPGRYDLTKPFAQSGMTYATDGRVAVRTLVADPVDDSPSKKLPNAAGLIWPHDELDRWRPWPKQQFIEHPSRGGFCPVCEGRNRIGGPDVVTQCKRCDGEGQIFDGSADDFWREDGKGWSNCPDCKGQQYVGGEPCDYCTGKKLFPEVQMIGELAVAGHYDNRVRTLPDLEFAIIERPENHAKKYNYTNDWRLIAFRSHDVQGLLMPLRVEA